MSELGDKIGSRLGETGEAVKAGMGNARERAHEMADAARAKGGERLESNPLALVAGGIAVGAIIGALLPRTQRERETVGGVGRAINERAREAVAVAKEVGTEKARELGLTGDSAREQMKSLFGKAGEAAKAAAGEAGRTVTKGGAAGGAAATTPDNAAASAPSGIPGGSGAAPVD